MTYNPSIPAADDLISESQGQLLTNFTQLNTVFDIDHVAFNDGTAANRGKHNQVTIIQGASDPTTLANENALYSKDDGGSQLFFRKESDGTVIQMTADDPVSATRGSSFLPGTSVNGLLINWGQDTTIGQDTTFTFPTAFSAAPFSIVTTEHSGVSGSSPVKISTATAATSTQFTVRRTAGNNRLFSWIAIGPA